MAISVTIQATDDTVDIVVNHGNNHEAEEFSFGYPGLVTGCELRDILEACGVAVTYEYDEGNDE